MPVAKGRPQPRQDALRGANTPERYARLGRWSEAGRAAHDALPPSLQKTPHEHPREHAAFLAWLLDIGRSMAGVAKLCGVNRGTTLTVYRRERWSERMQETGLDGPGLARLAGPVIRDGYPEMAKAVAKEWSHYLVVAVRRPDPKPATAEAPPVPTVTPRVVADEELAKFERTAFELAKGLGGQLAAQLVHDKEMIQERKKPWRLVTPGDLKDAVALVHLLSGRPTDRIELSGSVGDGGTAAVTVAVQLAQASGDPVQLAEAVAADAREVLALAERLAEEERHEQAEGRTGG